MVHQYDALCNPRELPWEAYKENIWRIKTDVSNGCAMVGNVPDITSSVGELNAIEFVVTHNLLINKLYFLFILESRHSARHINPSSKHPEEDHLHLNSDIITIDIGNHPLVSSSKFKNSLKL